MEENGIRGVIDPDIQGAEALENMLQESSDPKRRIALADEAIMIYDMALYRHNGNGKFKEDVRKKCHELMAVRAAEMAFMKTGKHPLIENFLKNYLETSRHLAEFRYSIQGSQVLTREELAKASEALAKVTRLLESAKWFKSLDLAKSVIGDLEGKKAYISVAYCS
ncbi:MAG: hypothetical protein V1702_04030 [Candidatus Woesearchaeota archaeon]